MKFQVKFFSIIKILFVISLLIFVGFEVYKSNKESKSSHDVVSFFSKDLLEATEIQILAGTNHLILKKYNLDWKITKPIQEFADIDMISTWLQQVVNSPTEAVPKEYKTLDWEKYGLSDPIAKITFKLNNGERIGVDVSATKSFNQQFYLKYTSKNLSQLLISDQPWLDFILKKPIDFVSSKNIFNFDTENVAQVKLKDFGDFVKTDGLWEFKGDKNIDPANIGGILLDIKKLNVKNLESNEIIISKNIVFSMELIFKDKTNEVIQIYDHFKDCESNKAQERCQLMRVASASYPFWVKESEIKSILNKSFKQVK